MTWERDRVTIWPRDRAIPRQRDIDIPWERGRAKHFQRERFVPVFGRGTDQYLDREKELCHRRETK